MAAAARGCTGPTVAATALLFFSQPDVLRSPITGQPKPNYTETISRRFGLIQPQQLI
jgi:hypothetical protein